MYGPPPCRKKNLKYVTDGNVYNNICFSIVFAPVRANPEERSSNGDKGRGAKQILLTYSSRRCRKFQDSDKDRTSRSTSDTRRGEQVYYEYEPYRIIHAHKRIRIYCIYAHIVHLRIVVPVASRNILAGEFIYSSTVHYNNLYAYIILVRRTHRR